MGLCRKIGNSQQVAMRRETEDIHQKGRNSALANRVVDILCSGSMSEGFRLKGSDFDYMVWPKKFKVIWELNQTQYYHRQTLIFANCTDSPPGFALLQLLTPNVKRNFFSVCIRMNSGLYISSSKYKEIMCLYDKKCTGSHRYLHGPCISEVHIGQEFDVACCLFSDFWPPTAYLWIDRCHTWPRPLVVQEIVKGGCHFVAIGHKLGNHEDDEWRISFSLAEQKLVLEMNHTQFLVYGLLKILSKEIFCKMFGDEGKLLCSYHMKTAIFWVIQQNTVPSWCPQNLLYCFWICFKLILKWVYEGVCPNFFIPENNMFLHNVYGEAQKNLFNSLYAIYLKGIAFLFYCPSIRSYVMNVIYNIKRPICTDERIVIPEHEFDVELFNEINSNYAEYMDDLLSCIHSFHTVELLIASPLRKYQVIMLQRYTADILQTTAFILHNLYINTGANKLVYVFDKMSCNMVKLAAKFGFISDMLYIAMYYYRTLRYKEALSVIQKIKIKLARPYIMRLNKVNIENYTATLGGESWSTKMREAVTMPIRLNSTSRYIKELIPELQFSRLNGEYILNIGDIIMLHMLEILCSIHIDRSRAQSAVNDLQVLVHCGQWEFPEETNDISWQILGICQEITGNHQGALYSYQQSLRQKANHKIQTATLMRIQALYSGC
ncbi:uncharacterized protein LOC133178249 [Saccostrea echinata]|uniref:uncharacterized protein LOC133178249 n=1 Tax=Saccostrea echinata TaxID=191078 RepID=UPI002A7F452B|nr:uncharacterized protein LOC133178249 [Saccostrea echinata]